MQRKKKPTQHQSQKIAAAHYRNEFFRKIKLVIDTFCGKNIYPLIPQRVLDDAYLCRSAPFKFQTAPGSTIPNNIFNDAKVFLPAMFRNEKVILPPHNLEITLNEYFTVVFTIGAFQIRLNDNDFKEALKVKEALKLIVSDIATNDNINQKMYGILQSFGFGQCDLSKNLYWYNHDYVLPKTLPAETENIILINSAVPETITVEIEGTLRPALRVGWAMPYTGPEWLSIKPSLLNINSPFAEIPLKVYTQSHALNRLSERIDCFWTGLVHFNMYVSLHNAKVFRDNNNNLLIEYRFFDTKAGYFRVDIVDGIIVVRTFLFVTNNSTPEGQLLEKNTGLQKLDKKYLAIDKLSTFMTSNLDKNNEVQKIFKSSGCQCLLDLYEKIKPLVTKHANQFDSNLMLNYLNIDNSNITATEAESSSLLTNT
jgi:hypothetical protein